MSNQLTIRDQAKQIGQVMQSSDYRKSIAQSMGRNSDDPVIDRFARVAMMAVQSDPKLLGADRQSFYLACQSAATDGLMPDGRQGKLVVYSTKQGNQWVDKVQWMRMVGGLRVLAARFDFDLIAHPVYENDHFVQRAGSDPGIDHTPAKLGQPRGEIIGYYAIATHLKTGRQYFETMDRDAVDAIKARTKSKKSDGTIVGPWASDESEMGRKTVAKRLFKSLPIADDDEAIQSFIRRDNEEYGEPAGDLPAQTAPETPQARPQQPSAYSRVIDQAPAEEPSQPEPVASEPIEGHAEPVELDPSIPDDAPVTQAPAGRPLPPGVPDF